MTPLSFDASTGREMLGDTHARKIETQARTDADVGIYAPPPLSEATSYWAKAQEDFARVVYTAQWKKRTARTARKAAQDGRENPMKK